MAKIFIFDNEPGTIFTLKHALENPGGHEVMFACTVRQATQSIMLFQPDVILVELSAGGGQVCEQVKQFRPTKHIPVIVTCHKGDHITEERVKHMMHLEYGADDFIAKPFTVERVMKLIESYLVPSPEAA